MRKDWQGQGMPSGRPGKYNLAEIHRWWRERLESRYEARLREQQRQANSSRPTGCAGPAGSVSDRTASSRYRTHEDDDNDDDNYENGAVRGRPALEKFREERARIARIERMELERGLMPRDAVHNGLARIVAVLRGAGEQLGRAFGADAVAMLNEALDAADREIEVICGQLQDSCDPDAVSHGDDQPASRSPAD